MAGVEHIQYLMNEIGPLVDGIEAIQQDGDDHWEIAFDEDTILEVDFSDSARKLTFAIEVGKPEESNRLKAYETILTYNYLWQDTDGVRMALDGPGGNVVQLFDLFETDLDLSTLANVVENLVEKARSWRDAIQSMADAESEQSLPGAGGTQGFENALRV